MLAEYGLQKKNWLSVLSANLYVSIVVCLLSVALQQMVTVPSAYIHYHQFLLSLRGHWASTKHCHLVPFPAILLTSLQLFPFANASLWTVLRHVCLGLPLLLFPCGFQSKVSLSMASCPFLSVLSGAISVS